MRSSPKPFVLILALLVALAAPPTVLADTDSDGDGKDDSDDNCPHTANADQSDLDKDDVGDACDPDDTDGPDGDPDGDGKVNKDDNCREDANEDQDDSDKDGIGDACDPDDTDGPEADPDGDGRANKDDNCPSVANNDQLDTDDDGIGDACDADDADGPEGDPDGDGRPNKSDNCPYVSNEDQLDSDKDEVGDACDTGAADGPEGDPDADGKPNKNDNCPAVANNDQSDADDDGIGDACDPDQTDGPEGDPDNDGKANKDDNCPHVANEDQLDSDKDEVGDACDETAADGPEGDPDGDGRKNKGDNCPAVANHDQIDSDGDGVGDACEPPAVPTRTNETGNATGSNSTAGSNETAGTADEDDAETPSIRERNVSVRLNDKNLDIIMERKDDQLKDLLGVSFDLDRARFTTSYKADAGNAGGDASLRASFHMVGEYRDTNGDGRYNDGEPIVSSWALSSDHEDRGPSRGRIAWQEPTVDTIGSGDKNGTRITVPGTLGENGTFALHFYVFGDYAAVGAASLRPTSVKIDIIIEDYPFEAPDTKLVLLLESSVEAEHEIAHDPAYLADDESAVSVMDELADRAVTLVFAWKQHALVDNVTRPVNSTLLEARQVTELDHGDFRTTKEQLFAFSYERGSRVVHDPEAYAVITVLDSQVAMLIPPLGQWPLIGLGALAAAAFVGLTLTTSIRRRDL